VGGVLNWEIKISMLPRKDFPSFGFVVGFSGNQRRNEVQIGQVVEQDEYEFFFSSSLYMIIITTTTTTKKQMNCRNIY